MTESMAEESYDAIRARILAAGGIPDEMRAEIENATPERLAAWRRRGITDALVEAVTRVLGTPPVRNTFIEGHSEARVAHYGQVVDGRHLVVLVEFGAEPQEPREDGL